LNSPSFCEKQSILAFGCELDCFASLAMTRRHLGFQNQKPRGLLRKVRPRHREGEVTEGGEAMWFAGGAGDLIQLKMRSTAAASPTANIGRGW
jgi:hypothetical protein